MTVNSAREVNDTANLAKPLAVFLEGMIGDIYVRENTFLQHFEKLSEKTTINPS